MELQTRMHTQETTRQTVLAGVCFIKMASPAPPLAEDLHLGDVFCKSPFAVTYTGRRAGVDVLVKVCAWRVIVTRPFRGPVTLLVAGISRFLGAQQSRNQSRSS